MKSHFLISNKKYSKVICVFIFLFIIPCLSLQCNNYSLPIIKDNTCITGGCTQEEFNNNTCIVANDIIKEQWLNNIIVFTAAGSYYVSLATTGDGDLICISNAYEKTKKYFYGLKSNGRPYFKENNIETSFNEIDTGTQRNEGNIYALKLNGGDKEYVVAFGANEAYFELYDFDDNNKVYKEVGTTFFQTGYNTFKYGSIFKLTNDINYYIISFIAQIPIYQTKSFYLIRYLFNNLDIAYNKPTTLVKNIDAGNSLYSSCFESENKYIFCFFLDSSNKYAIKVYDYNLQILAESSITSTYYTDTTFYKCVHFVGDSGAFLYYDTDKNIAIQFKSYIYNK